MPKKQTISLANSIHQKFSALNNFYQDLGISTFLCAKSSYHQNFNSAHILAYIVPSLRYNQYKIYYKELEPVAIVCWAFLSDEISALYEKGDYILRMNDFNSGSNVWITEFIISNDDEKIREELIGNLKEEIFSEKEVKVIVRNSDGTVKRIFTSAGKKYNKA
jgi:hemolysin-activating ACP:hemolysin acyltransferase